MTKTTLTASQHKLRNESFSPGVIEITQTLHKHNFEAYIVGGAVRDLLLDIQPKDFDVATNATPEQITHIFRRSRIIGRRFKIVHVMTGRETIEVTTFRGSHSAKELKKSQNDEGLLLSDNNYGSLEEDAQRRDFSANALYYDPSENTVIDFCGGFDAIERKQLSIIGDPEQRFREDPVRMLRAVRLQAKLPLDIEEDTYVHLLRLTSLLQQVPPARLFDEMLKLTMNGKSYSSFVHLHQASLLNELIPSAARHYEKPVTQEFFHQALKNSDKRVSANQPITPSFLIAVFLWPELKAKVALLKEKNKDLPPQEIWSSAMHFTMEEQHAVTSIPKRFQSMIREIWQLQSRLERHTKQSTRAKSLLAHPRFRAAYDFLVLRESSKETDSSISDWWSSFQVKHADILEQAKQERAQKNRDRIRKKPRRRK